MVIGVWLGREISVTLLDRSCRHNEVVGGIHLVHLAVKSPKRLDQTCRDLISNELEGDSNNLVGQRSLKRHRKSWTMSTSPNWLKRRRNATSHYKSTC